MNHQAPQVNTGILKEFLFVSTPVLLRSQWWIQGGQPHSFSKQRAKLLAVCFYGTTAVAFHLNHFYFLKRFFMSMPADMLRHLGYMSNVHVDKQLSILVYIDHQPITMHD